ncbi:hypothetical protein ACFL6Z_06100 [Pseudomonadota bacterium]|uniref:pyroglutamyl-peptidase I family protein n=1 Tax=unclassified Shewanella TaxID=196818 RepID=UPI000C828E28|nr:MULTISPECIES: hypothetical protein [unclassified Shewanella]MDO6620329.1 hypothetical protein [Shewanella sp. 6_MG-2023]MDO6679866.1 hypothetical protein [Shewanella sp. 4_MG-2023]MDO6774564.1 hypothetical protein [Shewanella sp. 3_MG-2023]
MFKPLFAPLFNRTALAAFTALLLTSAPTVAQGFSIQRDVEELRLPTALSSMPAVVNQYEHFNSSLGNKLVNSTDELVITQMVAAQGTQLWQQAVADVQSGKHDDRGLYWSRLAMRETLKTAHAGYNIVPWQRDILIKAFEKSSRGLSDIQFLPESQIKILVTGFDPFFLDKHIDQSNPSGLTALALDGVTFNVNGKQAQIETVMIPVRFADFDNGMIESLLTPMYRDNSVDMIFTVSMGRDNFDLERFPARGRSAAAPDNLNVYTGANKTTPMAPLFNGGNLNGPEFVEFSLPVSAMKQAQGDWSINDNHQVTSISRGQFDAKSIYELANEQSVEGSGGGYLSNEISYRSILLKQQFNRTLPVGHIHTPRVAGFDAEMEWKMVQQIREMVKLAAGSL